MLARWYFSKFFLIFFSNSLRFVFLSQLVSVFNKLLRHLAHWFCNILSSPTRLLYLPHERRIAVYWTPHHPFPSSSPVVALLLYQKVGKLNAPFGPFSQLKRLLTLRTCQLHSKIVVRGGGCACVLKLYSYHIIPHYNIYVCSYHIYLCVCMCLCVYNYRRRAL